VITQLELEERLAKGWGPPASVAFIQCIGCRDRERPWCSRVCCGTTVRQALELKRRSPRTDIWVFYRDMRTYGLMEDEYRRAAEEGVNFVRFEEGDGPELTSADRVGIDFNERGIGARIHVDVDLVVLAAAILPPEGNERLAKMLKVPLTRDGFFLEAHMKLRPVDFATDGIFLAGLAHSPKRIDETLSQAAAAAARAVAVLSQGTLLAEGIISTVDEGACTGCGTCIAICPFGAIERTEDDKARVVGVLCKGCGVCAAMCPEGAIDILGFTDEQLAAQVRSAFEEGP